VSLSLPECQITYVFVVSLLASANVQSTIIIHLVRKTRVLTVTGFCLIGVGESYTAVQGKIEKMISTQMNCGEENGCSSIFKMLPAGYSTLGNTTTWQEVNANEAEESKD
jgi:hypothetical protein